MHGKLDSQDVNNISLLAQPQTSKLNGDAKEECLDVILDDLAVQYTQMGPIRWSDISAWFIKVINPVLDHANFKEITKLENTFEHKCI